MAQGWCTSGCASASPGHSGCCKETTRTRWTSHRSLQEEMDSVNMSTEPISAGTGAKPMVHQVLCPYIFCDTLEQLTLMKSKSRDSFLCCTPHAQDAPACFGSFSTLQIFLHLASADLWFHSKVQPNAAFQLL